MSNSSIRFAWEGDQSEVWADFYTDATLTTPLTFSPSATVVWQIVSEDGSTLVGTFDGEVNPPGKNRLVGIITDGAPAPGRYHLFARVTQHGYTNTYPGNGAPRLILSVAANPIPE